VRLAIAAVALLAGACVSAAPTAIPNPPAAPAIDCRAPADVCRSAVDDARLNADVGTVPIRVQVVCTVPVCTPQRGEAQVDVQYSNLRTDSYTTGWAAAAPAVPPAEGLLSVEPSCGGVPRQTCIDLAASAVAGIDPASIVTIELRCVPAACTNERGDGETLVTLVDGSTHTSEWGY
jgi:hypothetical protein